MQSHFSRLLPCFYQGQYSGAGAEPDHYVDRLELKRGMSQNPREYMWINGRTAILKLSTCCPKFPLHQDSVKVGWRGVPENTHSFKFRRDYGALQQRLGMRVMQLSDMIATGKHTKTHCLQRVSYSLTQCQDVNGTSFREGV